MMNNKEFSKLLEKRTRDFSVRIIRLSTALPNTPEGREIRRQITKSGTSVGANYREPSLERIIQIQWSRDSDEYQWSLRINSKYFKEYNNLSLLSPLPPWFERSQTSNARMS